MANPTERDMTRLKGVDPKLVKVVCRTISEATFKIQVSEGVRTLARQKELFAQGRTVPGKKVTWSMNSKHLIQQDGFGHAVDLVPVVNGVVPWNDQKVFTEMGKLVLAIAKEEGVVVRWGHDWDMDGILGEKGETDSPHFEVVKK